MASDERAEREGVLEVSGFEIDLDRLYREMHRRSRVSSDGQRVYDGGSDPDTSVKWMLRDLFGVPSTPGGTEPMMSIRVAVNRAFEARGWATKPVSKGSKYVLHRELTEEDERVRFALSPGDSIVRKTLHDRFGGRRQGGIGPSAQTPNVFLFTDPESGQQHGYYDGWGDDGLFHYTGEGQLGDQEMISGNRAILEHARRGRSLRLFRGSGGEVLYLGEFEVYEEDPYYYRDAPETGGGPLRRTIVFRLSPAGGVVREGRDDLPFPQTDGPLMRSVSVEEQHTESFIQNPSATPTTAYRREQALVLRFKEWLEVRGHRVTRHEYRTRDGATPMYSDLVMEDARVLIEAKGSETRQSVRLAIGQLFDYRRYEPNGSEMLLAVLLADRPRADLSDLLTELGIAVIWADADTFRATRLFREHLASARGSAGSSGRRDR